MERTGETMNGFQDLTVGTFNPTKDNLPSTSPKHKHVSFWITEEINCNERNEPLGGGTSH